MNEQQSLASLAEWNYVLDLADERERRGRRGDEQQPVAELDGDDVLAVEYYDQLEEEERRAYRAAFDSDLYVNPSEVKRELDRIDAGMKAHCLS